MIRFGLQMVGAAGAGVLIGLLLVRCTPKDEQASVRAAQDVCTVIVATPEAGVDDLLRQLLIQIEGYENAERLRALGRDGGAR